MMLHIVLLTALSGVKPFKTDHKTNSGETMNLNVFYRKPFPRALVALCATALLLFTASCQSLSFNGNNAANVPFHQDPALIEGQLDNGLKYVLKENHEPKNRVSMHLFIRAGSIDESEEQRGLAHFLEHMMFNGSRHFPPGELVKYFQSIGMQFGGDANAHTGFYETVYDVVLPRGDEKDLSGGLTVLRDYADGVLLLEDEVDRERNVILAEKRDRDSADYRTFEESLKFELPDMRLTHRLPIGLASVIEKADSAALKQFYEHWYRPDNMVLVLVGECDMDMAQRLIRETFSSFKAPDNDKVRDPDPGTIHHSGLKTFYHYEKESGKTSVSMEVLTQIPRREDSLAVREQKILEDLASRMVQNRLDALTRKGDSPVTSASIAAGVFLRHVKYGSISADCSPENWGKALAFIEQNLRQALTYGFSEQELERVKQEYLSQLEQDVKTASTRDSNMVSSQILMSLAKEEVFLSPQDTLDCFGPFVRGITLDDMSRTSREIWDKDHMLVMVTGNADLNASAEPPADQIKTAYLESTQVPVQPRVEETKVVFPYLEEPASPGAVRSSETQEDLGITVVEFENGVRLNLKKTDYDANQFVFKLIFGGGKSEEPLDKPGLSSLASSVVNESGFGALDNEELKRALTGKNTQVMFSVGEDSFAISGSSVPDETALLFQLIRTQILDPGFRKDAYELSMERMKQTYGEMDTTVEGKDAMEGDAFFGGNDPRFGFPPLSVYLKNSLEDVKNWVGAALKDDQLELSLVGDFDQDTVIRMAAFYLGSLPKGRTPYAPLTVNDTPLPRLPRDKSLTLTVKSVIPKALVKVAYPTDDFWDITRTRRLSVLGSVFSDKLRNTIREELGAAYSPYAYNLPSLAFPGYGVFQAVVTVDPKQAELVTKKIKIIADRLAEEGITDDELKRSVDPILTSIKDMKRSNRYWLTSVMSGSGRAPVRYDWARSMETEYASITAKDILAMAEQYLDNDKAATLVITPGIQAGQDADSGTLISQ